MIKRKLQELPGERVTKCGHDTLRLKRKNKKKKTMEEIAT